MAPLGRSDGPGEMMNERPLKDKHICFLTLCVKVHYRASDPCNGRGTDVARGLPRVSICLDIIFAQPLLMSKIRGAVCGYKTLNTTRRTARPYASTATVFLFTSIIELTVPHAACLSSCLPEKGSERSPCRISFKEKLLGHLNQSSGLDCRRETKTKNSDAYAGYAALIANIGPKPAQTCLVGASHRSYHQGNVTNPHFCFN